MSEIRTHDEVIGIVGILAQEAYDDCDAGREQLGTQTTQAIEWLIATDAALRLALEAATRERDEAIRLRDLHWREVESLRERLDKEEEERGRQYGLRVQAEAEVKRLTGLVQHWYGGRARIGAHMTFVDQRFCDAVRGEEGGKG